jgi:hypothetical protein
VPDYLPNKPTVVGSRGSEGIPQGYFNKNPIGSGGSGAGSSTGAPGLPVLSNPYQSSVAKNSALGGSRVKSLPPGAPGAPGGYIPTYKYGGMSGSGIGGGLGGSGIGGGIGGDGGYGMGGGSEQSIQGA